MNKRALLIILVIVGIASGLLIWQSGMQSRGFQRSVMAAESSPTTTEQKVVSVAIQGYAFKDQIIKVHKGTNITWTNQDNAPHTVTSDMGSSLDSKVLNRGDSYSMTMNTVGTYTYHCTPHPHMMGAVIVVE